MFPPMNGAVVRENAHLPGQILLLVMAGDAGVDHSHSGFGAAPAKCRDEAAELVEVVPAMPACGPERRDSTFPFPPPQRGGVHAKDKRCFGNGGSHAFILNWVHWPRIDNFE